MKRIYSFVIVISLFFNTSMAQNATFQVTYNGFSAQAQQAFDVATQNWSNNLISNVPIRINAHYVDATGLGFIGLTISNGIKDFQNAPLQNTWYVSSLADALAGVDLQPNDYDMDIFIDSTQNWYFGIDGNPPSNQFDFIDVMMHEIGHGLGYFSAANVAQNEGSFSLVVNPLITIFASFPLPNLQGEPMIYDRFVENLGGDLLIDTLLFPNPSVALKTAFESNFLYFNGTNAVVANNNNRPRLYAPATFAFGSSLLHLNEVSFPTNTPDAMMTPFSSPGEAIHQPGVITLGMLQDFGWSLSTIATERIHPTISQLSAFPNPFQQQTTLTYWLDEKAMVNVEVYNILGKRVKQLVAATQDTGLHQIVWDGTTQNGTAVESGVYIYKIRVGTHVKTQKIIVGK